MAKWLKAAEIKVADDEWLVVSYREDAVAVTVERLVTYDGKGRREQEPDSGIGCYPKHLDALIDGLVKAREALTKGQGT